LAPDIQVISEKCRFAVFYFLYDFLVFKKPAVVLMRWVSQYAGFARHPVFGFVLDPLLICGVDRTMVPPRLLRAA
jgi:hypothetical protein